MGCVGLSGDKMSGAAGSTGSWPSHRGKEIFQGGLANLKKSEGRRQLDELLVCGAVDLDHIAERAMGMDSSHCALLSYRAPPRVHPHSPLKVNVIFA